MRELTEQGNSKQAHYLESGIVRLQELLDCKFDGFKKRIYRDGFNSAWRIQQRKLDAYAAYVASKITLKELEEVING